MILGSRKFISVISRRFTPFLILAAASVALSASAAIPRPCVGGDLPVETFKLLVIPPEKHAKPLPLDSVNRIQEGDRLRYEPVNLPPLIRNKARIALVLVPASETTKRNLVVLDAKKAKSPAQWNVPARSSIVGVVFGTHGLDVKKISNMVNRDPELIPELAAYAKQTATVNALISTLSQYDASRPGSEDLNAVLKGFSSQYGVALPHLDGGEPASQQAQQLLQALVPTVSNYDPLLSGRGIVMQQSAGIAASLAALFYGSPVGLAAGGAALVEGLRNMIFPNTDLRAAFVQPSPESDLELCSHNQKPSARSRVAYLWMLSIPDANAPTATLTATQNVPMGLTSKVKVTCATHKQLRILDRARNWRLVSGDHEAPVPVKVAVGGSADSLSLDLSKVHLPAGNYHLAALWDWQPFEVSGAVNVVPLGDIAAAALTPSSEDRLIAGSGPVKAELVGADFEFVKNVALASSSDDDDPPENLRFKIPKGLGEGTQLSLETRIDTSNLKPGSYRLLLTQTNGEAASVPVTVHPPQPKIENLPLRVNLGQPEQQVTLHGTRLERIQALKSPDAVWTLAPPPPDAKNVTKRLATVKLKRGARQGELLNAAMNVEGINRPIAVMGLATVAGPRPEIKTADVSFTGKGTVALEKNEIPAGTPVSFAIHVANDEGRPSLDLACADQRLTRQPLELAPGDKNDSAQLDFAGKGVLFLSLDPGIVGGSGCELTARVKIESTGVSDPYKLGRLVRLPQIEKFSLTDQKAGKVLYQGVLTGKDLQVIAKTGWNSDKGYSVEGIPTPVPDGSGDQTLKIAMPWPPPAPGAHVYVWLRGEDKGRVTTATY